MKKSNKNFIEQKLRKMIKEEYRNILNENSEEITGAFEKFKYALEEFSSFMEEASAGQWYEGSSDDNSKLIQIMNMVDRMNINEIE